MKSRLFFLIALVALVATLIGTALAGVAPQPFRSLTNKLEAVSMVLESVDMRLENLLMLHPPDPTMPPDPIEPVVNKLEAMSTLLMVLDNRTAEVIGMLPANPAEIPPEEGTTEALLRVATDASMVMERAQVQNHYPEEILSALMMVEMNASMIVMRVSRYLFPIDN